MARFLPVCLPSLRASRIIGSKHIDRQAVAQEFADYLIDGYWADRGWHSRQWETSEITYSVGDGFDDADTAAIAAALKAWSDVSALSFREVPSNGALSFQDGSDGKAWNLTASFRSGEILWSKISIDTSVSGWRDLGEPGGSGYFTLLHEIGHALGLGHPGNYNGGIVTRDQAHLADDSQQFSVMSYFGAFFTGANHQRAGDLFQASTPLLYDIVAIQRLYGPNLTMFQGDTVHRLDTGAVRTIWDAGGEDVLDFSDQTADQRISLEAGSFSDVGGMRGNLAIAFGTEIEAARGGAGNDTISGNALDNILQGGGGNDTLFGGAGADTFVFGDAHGDDRIADFISGIDQLDLSGAALRAVDARADGVFLETSQGSILLEGLGVEAFADLDLLLDLPMTEAPAAPPLAGPVGEIGTAALGARAVWIPFTETLDSPIVIARIQNPEMSEIAVVRIIETTDEGFRAVLQTPNASTAVPQETNIAFLAIEEGTHTLPDGLQIEAGSHQSARLTSRGFDQVEFEAAFETAPVVLSAVQTRHGGDFVVTRQRGLDSDGFRLAMQEEEARNRGGHVEETLGWIAIEAGTDSSGAVSASKHWTGTGPAREISEAPLLLHGLESHFGWDTAWSTANLGIAEDQSRDAETRHVQERLALIVAEEPTLLWEGATDWIA